MHNKTQEKNSLKIYDSIYMIACKLLNGKNRKQAIVVSGTCRSSVYLTKAGGDFLSFGQFLS